jgi:4-hydroxybenzoate polyprenyltransferase
VIISSFSSLLFLGMGYILIAKEQSLLFFPWKIFWFLFLAYCLVIPIKDFKDIKSDRLFGIKTLPVLIGEERARFFLATLMFLCYILSVYIIKESGLFLVAVLFGGISFWLIIDKKNTTNQLNWWLIGLVSLYSFFILSFIF